MPRFSIKTKLSAVLSILVLAVGLFNLVYFPMVARRQSMDQAVRAMLPVAETAGHALASALETRDRAEAERLLAGVRNLRTFSFLAVYDEAGQVWEATPDLPPWAAEFQHRGEGAPATVLPRENLLVATAPIYVRAGGGDRAGTLVVGFTTEDISRAVWHNVRRATWVGGIATLAALGLGLVLSRLFIRPLERLTAAARQVASGDFRDLALGPAGQDELGVLSRAFQTMTDKLKVSREEIELQNKLLESRVHERTGQLLETIWELEEIRANLEKLVQERTRGLEQSRAELAAWAGTLEEKVRLKTQELTDTNANLTRSLRQLQDLDRIKSEFLANMSHELRTPLNAVIGFSGLLMQERDGRVPAEAKVDLAIIHQNGKNLLGMIDSILDLSKMEAGKFELDLEPFDPYPVLEQVAALSAGLIGTRPIQFGLEILDRRGRVLGEAGRFKQVVTNLVGNAIKFTEQGEVVLRAETLEGRLRIEIRDTGIGMSEQEQQRLFRPFQQVDGSITRRFGGTGLGLALSQRLAQAMGGRITVASEKGRGSTFTVDLPLMIQEEART